MRMTKGLAWPRGRGESGKEVVKRLSFHLLGSNLAVLGHSEVEAEAEEGLLFSVWAQPAQHKRTTSDWAAEEVLMTGRWMDVKEPSRADWSSALAGNGHCLGVWTAHRKTNL